jgi:Tic22-like family
MSAPIFLLVAAFFTKRSSALVMNDKHREIRLDPLRLSRQRHFSSFNLHQFHDDDDPPTVAVEPVSDGFTDSRISTRQSDTIISRRNALHQTTAGLLAVSTTVSLDNFFPTIAISNAQEAAAGGSATRSEGVSTEKLADLLRAIPTFTIVDRQGIPYMVVGEDAKITCYFFTSFSEAQRLLDVASTSADKAIASARKEAAKDKKKIDPEDLINPWKQARISTVPLDFAATLVAKSVSAASQNGSRARGLGGNYFQIAASQDDIQNALSITGKDSLSEGKVPLFYMEDFTMPVITSGKDNTKEATKKTPLYFSKGQLEQDYSRLLSLSSKNNSTTGDELPEIKVTELFAVLVEMVSSGRNDPEIQNLFFVPPTESLQRAKECMQKGGKEFPPFVLGERNVIL